MVRQIKILIVLVLALAVFGFACAPTPQVFSFKILLPEGEGYVVENEQIQTVERGATVVFGIAVEAGYKIIGSSMGAFADGKLTIENVRSSRTVRLNCVRVFEVQSSVTNGLIRAELIDTDDYYEGAELAVTVEPLANYYIHAVSFNGVAQELDLGLDGSFYTTIELDGDLEVAAECLGDQYLFSYTISGGGQVEIEPENLEFDDRGQTVVHYGDTIDLKLIPLDNYRIGYIRLDGITKKLEGDSVSLSVNSHVFFEVSFSGINDVSIYYDINGGEISGGGGCSFRT